VNYIGAAVDQPTGEPDLADGHLVSPVGSPVDGDHHDVTFAPCGLGPGDEGVGPLGTWRPGTCCSPTGGDDLAGWQDRRVQGRRLRMAVARQVPVLPAAIHGTGRIWPPRRAAILAARSASLSQAHCRLAA